jgi:hypothetical protein
MLEKLVYPALSAAVGMGVAWGVMRNKVEQLRKDVNGLGRKVNRMKDAHLVYCSEAQRKEIAEFLRS